MILFWKHTLMEFWLTTTDRIRKRRHTHPTNARTAGADSNGRYFENRSAMVECRTISDFEGERIMPAYVVSRRTMFRAGACALAGTALLTEAASAAVSESMASANEAAVRKYYKLWEKKDNDWGPFDAILADDFTFSSPVDIEPLSKATFKKNCWDTQIAFTKGFDLELVMVKGDEALVKYVGHTMNGKSFRNMEYHQLRNQRIVAIKCYFGANMTFPSAVSSQTDPPR
jgi:hypothetical protein